MPAEEQTNRRRNVMHAYLWWLRGVFPYGGASETYL